MTIRTKPPSQEYDEGWERTFGKRCERCGHHHGTGPCGPVETKTATTPEGDTITYYVRRSRRK